MNASPAKIDSWPFRLRNGSLYLRTIFLTSTIIFGMVGLLGLGLNGANIYPSISPLSNWWILADAMECWLAYKLFSYYVRGDWFAPQAVRWMQAIGVLSLLRGVGNIWNNLYSRFHTGYFDHLQNSPVVMQAMVYVQFILSQLLHNLIFGCVILFIAWIMDEGRKIQEEQELTV